MPVHTYCNSIDHTYCSSIDHACTGPHIVAILTRHVLGSNCLARSVSDFLRVAVWSSVSRALVSTTHSLLDFLRVAVYSSVSRALVSSMHSLLVFLHLAVCSSISRALVSFTCSLSEFLHLAVCSLVSRVLAALTSLFLDAFLVVSGLLPRNTWPHGQASFLTCICYYS